MRWAQGQSGNLKGRPPSVFQSFGDRSGHFLKKYTRMELIALADDENALDKHSSFDCLVIRQLANALRANMGDPDLTAERERLYDRVIGKAISRVETEATVSVDVQVQHRIGPALDALPANVLDKVRYALLSTKEVDADGSEE